MVRVNGCVEPTTRIGLHSPPELLEYLRHFSGLFYRAEGRWAMNRYVLGLMGPVKRKNCEQMAAVVAGISANELQGLLTEMSWDYLAMDRIRVGLMLSRATVGGGTLVFDDTGIPKQGNDSVGVQRQYSGTLGKVGNCQITVTCRYADAVYTWPVTGRLYLPKKWTDDPERLKKAKVPAEVKFQTKVEIALGLLDQADQWGVAYDVLTSDGNYGDNSNFLAGLEARKKQYVVAVAKDFTVRLPADLAKARQEASQSDQAAGKSAADTEELESAGEPVGDVAPAATPKRRGRPPKPPRVLSPEERAPLYKACDLSAAQPAEKWRPITYREGTKGPITKEFVAIRACRALKGNDAGDGAYTGSEGWLIGERPVAGETGDCKWYYSNFPPEATLESMVAVAHGREPIERGYRIDKDGLGLDEAEVRLWHGFHRHQALVMLAECWLVLQRQTYQPTPVQSIMSIVQDTEVAVPQPEAVPSTQPGETMDGTSLPAERLAAVGPDAEGAMPEDEVVPSIQPGEATDPISPPPLPPAERAPAVPPAAQPVPGRRRREILASMTTPTPTEPAERPALSPPLGRNRGNPVGSPPADQRTTVHRLCPLAGAHRPARSPAGPEDPASGGQFTIYLTE